MPIGANVVGILSKLFRAQTPESPDFVKQLGVTIDKFSTCPVVIKQVAQGLALYTQGDFENGSLYLSSKGSNLQLAAYKPSGKHAYVYTELLALATLARRLKYFPHVAEYAWLNKADPTLFSLIIGVGNPVQVLSCAGVVAHYMEEIRQERAISEPMVEFAKMRYAELCAARAKHLVLV